MSRYTRHAVPSHRGATLQQLRSRVFSGLEAVTAGSATHSGAADLQLTLGISSAGTVTRKGASATFGLTLGIDTTGTVIGGVVAAPTLYRNTAPSTTLRGPFSRVFHGATPSESVFGSSELGLSLGIVSAGTVTRLGGAALGLTLGIATQGTVTRPGAAALGLTLGISSAGTVTRKGAAASLDLTFGVSTDGTVEAVTAVRLGVATAGRTNQGFLARPPEVSAKQALLESRALAFLATAPPIYRAIVQGGTNQGFVFRAGPQPKLEYRQLYSRIFAGLPTDGIEVVLGAASLGLTVDLATTGFVKRFGSAALELVLGIAATVPLDWTLVVLDEDGTLVLTVPSEGSETLSAASDDNTLTLVLQSEDSAQALVVPTEDSTLTLTVMEEQTE
jgi:hypothetical protein